MVHRKESQMMTNIDEAPVGKAQHVKPCHDCPMRKNSIPGWLGGYSPEEYKQVCHSDAPVTCHAIKTTKCAGVAIYRTHVVQRATFKLPADPSVFETPMAFIEWHTNQSESFKKLRLMRAAALIELAHSEGDVDLFKLDDNTFDVAVRYLSRGRANTDSLVFALWARLDDNERRMFLEFASYSVEGDG
jgi:hypothetical protein